MHWYFEPENVVSTFRRSCRAKIRCWIRYERQKAAYFDFRDHERFAEIQAIAAILNVTDNVCPESVPHFTLSALVSGHNFGRAIEIQIYREAGDIRQMCSVYGLVPLTGRQYRCRSEFGLRPTAEPAACRTP